MKTYINEITKIEWVEIEVEEGHFTSMPKSVYDEQQAAIEAQKK